MKTNFAIFKSTTLLFLIFGISLLVGSCGPKGLADANKPLFDEVMALHDAAMVKMDVINNRREALRKVVAKIDAEPNLNLSKEALLDAIGALQKADDAMMDWMHEFSHDYTGKSPEEVKAYLESEKAKIKSVSEAIDASIANADAILK